MPESRSTKPTALQRGQMRRRLRHQQRIREALLLDLGALVFELHRQGRREPELLQAKAAELTAVDNEVRALAEALEADATLEMITPGVAGICANCGTLLSTDDRFCPNCGTPAEPALKGEGRSTEDAIDASGNGSAEHGDAEVLEAAAPPMPEPAEREQVSEGGAEGGEDKGTKGRGGVDRLFGRRQNG
jgi:hypothetical protein